MKVRVASSVVPVEIAPAERLNDPGAELARIDLTGQPRCRISTLCAPTERLHALAGAVAEAWVNDVPLPRTRKEFARLVGTITSSLVIDVEASGGLVSLATMGREIRGQPDLKYVVGPVSGHAKGVLRECSVCQTRVSPGDVKVMGPVRIDPEHGPVVDLAFECEFCGDFEVASELANPAGRPTGHRVDYRRASWDEMGCGD